jgi:hypothetical protein
MDRHQYNVSIIFGLKVMIILVIFGSHLEKSRNVDFCCRYSNVIVSIDSVDLKYIGIDTNMRYMYLAFLV